MQQIDLIKLYRRKSALVIDDFPDMRGSIRRMLGHFGLDNIDTASNGEEAVQKCEQRHYDIILADYNLGDSKNGQQILEELRYRGLLRHTSLYIMITAETTKAMVFGALEYQPDDYLTKPITQNVLQTRLDRLMREREALHGINEARDRGDLAGAIRHCDEHIEARNRFRLKALQIKGQCLLQGQQFEQARALYEQVLDERPLDWAQIGLGKCLIALNELDRAEQLFQMLIDNGCLCLEIYDCLADIRNRKGDFESAKSLLLAAIEISPNAILRQQSLARICEENNESELAERAYRKVIRLGAHSCYESPESHFSLVRCIGARLSQGSDVNKHLKDIGQVLEQARRRYRDTPEVQDQGDVLAALYSHADPASRRQRLETLQESLLARNPLPAEALLELARAFRELGDKEHSRTILAALAAAFSDHAGIGVAIDRLADEPLSPQGRQRAAELNRQGKELFGSARYTQAIGLFSEALLHYPYNVTLNLNLLLAMVKEMTANGTSAPYLRRCRQILEALDDIGDEHPLAQRLQALRGHVEQMQAQHREVDHA